MRVTILATYGSNCIPIYNSLQTIGHELTVITYTHIPDLHQLPRLVDESKPDWVVMFGICTAGPDPVHLPTVGTLVEIGRRHPFVHLCCDASDPIWWPQLQQYYDADCFRLQVNVDGTKTGPIGRHGLTMLCPIDPAQFPQKPWAARPIELGFLGGYGGPHPRGLMVEELTEQNILTARLRSNNGPFSEYAEFMTSCRCVWNHAANGSGDRMQVKARVVETGFAGAVLFENEGSPTEKWFAPEIDYLSYDDVDSVRDGLYWIKTHPDEAEAMTKRLQTKMLEQHSPAIAWNKVIDCLGFR